MLRDRLKALRERAHLNQRDLSELARLSPSHVGLIEQGRIDNVSTDTAAEFARVLGCSLDWLVSGIGDEPSENDVLIAVAAARSFAGQTGSAA